MTNNDFRNISTIDELHRALRLLGERRLRADEKVVDDWTMLTRSVAPARLFGQAVKVAVEFASRAAVLKGVYELVEEALSAVVRDDKNTER